MKKPILIVLISLLGAVALWQFLVPSVTFCGLRADDAKALNNAKQLGIICFMYSKDHENKLPSSFQELLDTGYVTDSAIFYSPFGPKKDIEYEFTSAATFPSIESNQIVVSDRYRNKDGRRAVYFSSGDVRMVKD